MTLEQRFHSLSDDNFLEFDMVKDKLSNRMDLHVLMTLDKWFPSPAGDDILFDNKRSDDVGLCVSKENAESMTDDQIVELIRCGVSCRDYYLPLYLNI